MNGKSTITASTRTPARAETQLMLSAADAVMSPEQRDLFDKIGERDPDVYARLLSRIVKMLAGEGR
jgi:hypothetical protein